MQGSSFEPCPVCSKSVASALLAFHINSCLEESIKGGHSAHSTSEQKAQDQHESIGAAPITSTGNPGELIQPLHEDAQPQAATHARAAYTEASEAGLNTLSSAAQQADLGASQFTGCTDKASLGEEQSPAHAEHVACLDQAAQDSLHEAQHKDAKQHDSTQPAAKSESAVPKKAAPANNAFAHMMQKQKERAQTWTFFLGRDEDGSLFWHMWRDVKGAQPLPNIVTHCSGQWRGLCCHLADYPTAGICIQLVTRQAPHGSRLTQTPCLSTFMVKAVLFYFSCCYVGIEVGIQAPDQATVQRCRQQVAWSAESQASLADLECRVDISADRAASGKVINDYNRYFKTQCVISPSPAGAMQPHGRAMAAPMTQLINQNAHLSLLQGRCYHRH